MAKLNQVLAIEKGIKSKSHSEITKMYHSLQKPGLFSGFFKNYRAIDEEGQHYPQENQKVQIRADDLLKDAVKVLSELFDVTAQKDFANCNAKANIVIDNLVLAEDVPVTYLLFLEKQLTDVKTLIGKLPVLDSSEDWTWDDAAGLFKTSAVQTTRTQKVTRPIVLYDATEHHPAQTQLISEDVVVGHWATVKQSGAVTADKKIRMLEKVEKLLNAVKYSRETANSADAPKQDVAGKLFGYILD